MNFETQFETYMRELCTAHPDPSHDILHVQRVVALAKKLGNVEKAEMKIVVPAAYLHDCVYISKTDERRTKASRISADRAIELLKEWNYPEEFSPAIHHAISAHSFSAKIPAETLEAKIVQDADRLDAMGAVGIFRCFAFSGLARRPFYNVEDPFCLKREPNDQTNTLDHFYAKLLLLYNRLNTPSAKAEGDARLATMRRFLDDLKTELT
jgi:uncharacterized protein